MDTNLRNMLLAIAAAVLAIGGAITVYVNSESPSPTPSPSPSAIVSPMPSPSISVMPSPSPSASVAPSPSPSPSVKPSPSPSPSPSPKPSPSASVAPSPSPSVTPSPSSTVTASVVFSKPNRDALSFSSGMNLFGSRGETISAVLQLATQSGACQPLAISSAQASASFYKMTSVTTSSPSFTGARVGSWLDPLVPVNQVCVGDQIWMDLAIPTGAVAGLYSLPYGINLTVWSMTMPGNPTLPIYTEMQSYSVMLASGFPSTSNVGVEGPVAIAWSNFLRQHRIEPVKQYIVGYSPPLNSDGTLNLTQWASSNASYQQIVLTGAIAPPMLVGPGMTDVPTMKSIDAAIVAGTLPVGTWAYACDEAACSTSITQTLKTNAPHLKVMATVSNQPGGANSQAAYAASVDQFYVVLDWFSKGTNVLGAYTSCMAQGSCSNGAPSTPSGTPMMLIDAPTVHPRAFPWVLSALGMTKGLYYNSTQSIGTAWTNQYYSGGNGDGNLLYVGTDANHTPNASIRLKMLRQGSYDIEYLNWAKSQNIAFTSPATSATQWSKNVDDYETLRVSLGTQLNGKLFMKKPSVKKAAKKAAHK